jgi:uncharacterized protein (UPF0332 family)
VLAIHLYDVAGRMAYLAGFHAAQAFIFEKSGRSAKTHKGVHAELHRLTKDDPTLDSDLRVFLSRNYDLKNIADYETGPDAAVAPERAQRAVREAKRFVAHFGTVLREV